MQPTANYLRQILRYEPETGKLFWRVPKQKRNLSERAGNYDHVANRWSIFIDGKRFLQHRVIWTMQTGVWPVSTVDHEDGDSSNNTWRNLREATLSEQQQNTRLRKDSVWGRGIHYDKTCDCFRVLIQLDGVVHKQRCDTYGEAQTVAKELYETLHPNRRIEI